MLYVIGLAHRAQSRNPAQPRTEAQSVFERTLRQTIERVQPSLIAEENSDEALAENRVISISREVAGEIGIEHRLCDPTQAERRAVGYKDGQSLEMELFMSDEVGLSNEEIFLKARAIEIGRYFPIRERIWLDRLPERRRARIIFACGDAHIESFGNLLAHDGIPFEIVERGIGVVAEDRRFYRAFQYLREHPELAHE